MVATRLATDSKRRAVPERRSSSRIQLHNQERATSGTPEALDSPVAKIAPPAPIEKERELTDAEIEATLRHADVLELDVKRALVTLRRETLRVGTRPPVAFALPFTPEEMKSIGVRSPLSRIYCGYPMLTSSLLLAPQDRAPPAAVWPHLQVDLSLQDDAHGRYPRPQVQLL
jgi:hypothetical protein